MSKHLDSYLAQISVALFRGQLDIEGAVRLLAEPRLIGQVDGENIKILIRSALIGSQIFEKDCQAEVAALLGTLKPDLEIDYGLDVGCANAQSCALFAMYSISFQKKDIIAALRTLQRLKPALAANNDRKGLLEVRSWQGILHNTLKEYGEATGAFYEVICMLKEDDMDDALQDNSTLDMVRADNKNVFAFPMLPFLKSGRSGEIAKTLSDLIASIQLNVK